MPKPFINPKIWKQLHEPKLILSRCGNYANFNCTFELVNQIHFQLFLQEDVLQHKINAKETFIVLVKSNMLYSLCPHEIDTLGQGYVFNLQRIRQNKWMRQKDRMSLQMRLKEVEGSQPKIQMVQNQRDKPKWKVCQIHEDGATIVKQNPNTNIY